jgi:hypothetical protein
MKKVMAVFISFIVMGLFPWQIHCDEKKRLELGFKIVEKTRIAKMFIDLSEASMENYFENYESTGEQSLAKVSPMKKIFIDEVTLGVNELKWMLAEIYANQFSENELTEIMTFFDSSAGKAWLDKRLLIQTESEQVGLEWGQLLTQRVLNKFEAQFRKKK